MTHLEFTQDCGDIGLNGQVCENFKLQNEDALFEW